MCQGHVCAFEATALRISLAASGSYYKKQLSYKKRPVEEI